MRLFVFFFAYSLSLGLAGAPLVTNCSQLARHITDDTGDGLQFQLQGVQCTCGKIASLGKIISFQDEQAATPSIIVSEKCYPFVPVTSGDIVNASGVLYRDNSKRIMAYVRSLSLQGHKAPIQPKFIKGPEFYLDENDYRAVRLQGNVNELITDEIDPRCRFLVLLCQGEVVYVATRTNDVTSGNLIGATIDVSGTDTPRLVGNRIYLGRTLQLSSLTVIADPPSDPFDLPDISRISLQTPNEIFRAGRHCASGRVLAVWNHGRTFLVQTDSAQIVQVDHTRQEPPEIGSFVKVAGIPHTNTHCLNLARADWTNATSVAVAEPNSTARQTSAREIMEDESCHTMIKPQYHGQLIRISGIVRGLFTTERKQQRLVIENDGYLIPVDLYGCSKASEIATIGCKVDVEGVCVMEVENMTPGLAFPHLRGFSVIPRKDSDIVVIARPPWWTPARFAMILFALLGVLIVIFLWNLTLQVLVKRRARQLFKAELSHATSELRVKDRTRLAVELHDSLSQNLTGVSMEVEAAVRHGTDDPETMQKHLLVAHKILTSCRKELRNSLWDLRNDALEERDMNEAIRRALLPHLQNVNLHVRFNVPRSRLTDNTTHEILRIIRELAVNGISHGGATEIHVAGSIDSDTLLFSVRDNGCGFDPDTAPGVLQGHFGLEGVRERLNQIRGRLTIKSEAGAGVKATVSIRLQQNTNKPSES